MLQRFSKGVFQFMFWIIATQLLLLEANYTISLFTILGSFFMISKCKFFMLEYYQKHYYYLTMGGILLLTATIFYWKTTLGFSITLGTLLSILNGQTLFIDSYASLGSFILGIVGAFYVPTNYLIPFSILMLFFILFNVSRPQTFFTISEQEQFLENRKTSKKLRFRFVLILLLTLLINVHIWEILDRQYVFIAYLISLMIIGIMYTSYRSLYVFVSDNLGSYFVYRLPFYSLLVVIFIFTSKSAYFYFYEDNQLEQIVHFYSICFSGIALLISLYLLLFKLNEGIKSSFNNNYQFYWKSMVDFIGIVFIGLGVIILLHHFLPLIVEVVIVCALAFYFSTFDSYNKKNIKEASVYGDHFYPIENTKNTVLLQEQLSYDIFGVFKQLKGRLLGGEQGEVLQFVEQWYLLDLIPLLDQAKESEEFWRNVHLQKILKLHHEFNFDQKTLLSIDYIEQLMSSGKEEERMMGIYLARFISADQRDRIFDEYKLFWSEKEVEAVLFVSIIKKSKIRLSAFKNVAENKLLMYLISGIYHQFIHLDKVEDLPLLSTLAQIKLFYFDNRKLDGQLLIDHFKVHPICDQELGYLLSKVEASYSLKKFLTNTIKEQIYQCYHLLYGIKHHFNKEYDLKFFQLIESLYYQLNYLFGDDQWMKFDQKDAFYFIQNKVDDAFELKSHLLLLFSSDSWSKKYQRSNAKWKLSFEPNDSKKIIDYTLAAL
ncbi:hypothetical protein NH26_00645 [Flammeovirga pacifica]|uniref:Uncharacterized protein n=2 Tax=Flammeovirga pacifica TaxID=915059 RepID=A0A1S1YV95_FLAPC|nr:hypothetical protein NH26_00645 [Flammeovirga pacifica]